jgi:catechol 2,3-dioxygenase-like lactoylglutathione lyase family enzyme
MNHASNQSVLDSVDHIAIQVENIAKSVLWYTKMFKCKVDYQDDTWAFLCFDNIKIALVIPDEHPPHLALASSNASKYGELTTHRDGTKSVYIKDPTGNSIEILEEEAP